MDIRDRNSRRGFLGNKHVFGDQGPGAQVLPECQTTPEHGPHIRQVLWILGLLALVWLMPNTLQWAAYRPPAGTPTPRALNWAAILRWRPSTVWALGLSAASITCLLFMSRGGTFLYFQF